MVSVDAMVTGGKQLYRRQWIGLLIGFAGIVMLVWPDITAGGASGGSFAFGVIAVQIACAGWAIGSSYTRRHVMPRDVLGSAALQMFFGGIFMTAAGTSSANGGGSRSRAERTAAFVYLMVVGAVIAFAAYSYALRHLDIAIVSLYTYVNPVIAVALGTLLLDEPFGLRMLIAAAVIVRRRGHRRADGENGYDGYDRYDGYAMKVAAALVGMMLLAAPAAAQSGAAPVDAQPKRGVGHEADADLSRRRRRRLRPS